MVDRKFIAISSIREANNIELLSTVSGYGICDTPRATIVDGKVIANFDYYFDLGIVPNVCLQALIGDKYIPFNRHPKQVQAIILKGIGISHPITAFPVTFNDERHDHNVYNSCGASINDLANITDGDLVVKSGNQAEGKGQALVKYKDLTAFTNMHLGKVSSPIERDTEICTLGGVSTTESMSLLHRDTTALIQEKVNPVIELRMLFSANNDVVVEERAINTQQGWQSRGGKGKVIYSGGLRLFTVGHIQNNHDDISINMPNDGYWDNFIGKLIQLIEEIGYPFGSIDIYLAQVADDFMYAGAFEYCPQFAYAGIGANVTRDLITSGIDCIISKIEELDPDIANSEGAKE